jgi:hypothetical protein
LTADRLPPSFGWPEGGDEGDSDDSELRAEDIPATDAPSIAIWKFALTFNGYRNQGSFEKCDEIANEERDATLVDLLTCLFFERQRWQHYGDEQFKGNSKLPCGFSDYSD